MRRDTQKSLKKHSRIRLFIQLAFAAIINGYMVGYAKGNIFTGKSKIACVPVLNCYSCPGALSSCPIGAMQAVVSGYKHNISFYILGTIMLFGVILGRFICGFLCPFGLFQDLLHKIPSPKLQIHRKIDNKLRYLKYIIAITTVIILPVIISNQFGMGSPHFCKWICPAGTLGGAIPLISKNEALRNSIGLLFSWKMAVLILISTASIFISRPFCKYICPLGAFYAVFNKFSFYQLKIDPKKCTGCKACNKVCPMDIDVVKDLNSAECIKCGRCKSVCSPQAIK